MRSQGNEGETLAGIEAFLARYYSTNFVYLLLSILLNSERVLVFLFPDF